MVKISGSVRVIGHKNHRGGGLGNGADHHGGGRSTQAYESSTCHRSVFHKPEESLFLAGVANNAAASERVMLPVICRFLSKWLRRAATQ